MSDTTFSELYAETQKLTYSPQGFTGVRRWRIGIDILDDFLQWASRSNYPGFPKLRCVSIEQEGLKGGQAQPGYYTYSEFIITAHYSSAPWLDEPPQESMEMGVETFETGEGRVWKNAGTVMESSMTIQKPTLIRNITLVQSSIPLNAILSTEGKVNASTFQGFPAGTLLFLGATTDTAYRWETGDYVYRITYRLSWTRYGWNIVWRQPRQALDDTGSPAFDEAGNPVFVEGPAGEGGWDMPIPALYESAYFEPLFGMPLPGQGPKRPYVGFSASNKVTVPAAPTPNIPWLKIK